MKKNAVAKKRCEHECIIFKIIQSKCSFRKENCYIRGNAVFFLRNHSKQIIINHIFDVVYEVLDGRIFFVIGLAMFMET